MSAVGFTAGRQANQAAAVLKVWGRGWVESGAGVPEAGVGRTDKHSCFGKAADYAVGSYLHKGSGGAGLLLGNMGWASEAAVQ